MIKVTYNIKTKRFIFEAPKNTVFTDNRFKLQVELDRLEAQELIFALENALDKNLEPPYEKAKEL